MQQVGYHQENDIATSIRYGIEEQLQVRNEEMIHIMQTVTSACMYKNPMCAPESPQSHQASTALAEKSQLEILQLLKEIARSISNEHNRCNASGDGDDYITKKYFKLETTLIDQGMTLAITVRFMELVLARVLITRDTQKVIESKPLRRAIREDPRLVPID